MKTAVPILLSVVAFCCWGCAQNRASADEQMTTLQTGSPHMELTLASAAGSLRLQPNSQGAWQVPPGTHRSRAILLKTMEKQGRRTVEWTLSGTRGFGRLARIETRAGETLAIPAGAPLVAKATVQRFGSTVYINAALTGRAGEQYEAGARRNGRAQPAPTLKIIAEDGTTIATGKFEYG